MLRDNFPILNQTVNRHKLIYLDSAATMQMPLAVQRAMQEFYENSNANIHRGIHTLSEQATARYEEARETVRQFIDAASEKEIIFTSGTTASVNMAAGMLEKLLRNMGAEAEILVSAMEHHSNLLPWMELAKRQGMTVQIIPTDPDGCLDRNAFEELLTEKTKVVAFTEVSNVTGIRNPVKEMVKEIRERTSAFVLVDGAQGIVHDRQSVRQMGADFYCFSGHKLGGPTGVGVLYMREALQKQLQPLWYGGGIVHAVTYGQVDYVEGPSLFEPGTPNYAGVIGMAEAMKFWMGQEKLTKEDLISQAIVNAGGFGSMMQEILELANGIAGHESDMLEYVERELSELDGVHVLGAGQKHFGCLSFVIDGMHPYDVCRLLDEYGIAVRSGHMCAQPYVETFGCSRVIRVSVAPYNTMSEMERFVECLGRMLVEVRTVDAYRQKNAKRRARTMKEAEAEILRELHASTSATGQYVYLESRAENCLLPPEQYRDEAYKVASCQVDTRLIIGWMNGKRVLFADSESVLVKGILALLQEIYMDRTREEIEEYRCEILEDEGICRRLNQTQLESLRGVIRQLSE